MGLSVNRSAGRRVRGVQGSKRDANEPAIIDAFRRCGASVTRLSFPGGPDLLVGYQRQTFLVEVKSTKGKLTESQVLWVDSWRGGDVVIVRTPDDALRLLGVIA
jgi:hypothetical protein